MKAQKHIAEIDRMHRIASERFGLSIRDTTLQAAYIEEVIAQFSGATSESAKTERTTSGSAARVQRPDSTGLKKQVT